MFPGLRERIAAVPLTMGRAPGSKALGRLRTLNQELGNPGVTLRRPISKLGCSVAVAAVHCGVLEEICPARNFRAAVREFC